MTKDEVYRTMKYTCVLPLILGGGGNVCLFSDSVYSDTSQ